MDDDRRLMGSSSEARQVGRRGRVVLVVCVASAVLMVAVAAPASSPDVVFPTYYSIELVSSLLLGGLYLFSLLLAGLRWIQLGLDIPGNGMWHDRSLAVTGLAVCLTAAFLVPVEAMRIVGAPPQELLRVASWQDGITFEAWASLATSCLGVLAVALTRTAERRAWRLAGWAAPLVVVVSPTWLGHSRSEAPRSFMVMTDVAHLAVGAWWLAGVAVFAVVLSVGPQRGMRAADVTGALARFSASVRISVAVIVVSGVLMAVLILDRPGDVVESGWGRALLLKIVLVAVVVGMARWNESRLPAAVARCPEELDQWRVVRMVMVSEVVLLMGIVLLTGFLTQMSPG